MTVTITYTNGDTARLPSVQKLELIGPRELWVTTFGNQTTIHRRVEAFEVDPFVFPTETGGNDELSTVQR